MTELQQLANDLSNEVRNLTTQLDEAKKKAEGFRNQLLDARHELFQKDYTLENQRKAFETVRVTLERFERENKALRELVGLWI